MKVSAQRLRGLRVPSHREALEGLAQHRATGLEPPCSLCGVPATERSVHRGSVAFALGHWAKDGYSWVGVPPSEPPPPPRPLPPPPPTR